jgi:two-component sensor histidine kinase
VSTDVDISETIGSGNEVLNLRQLLAQAGIDAAEQKAIEQLQQMVVVELHHRLKNTIATVLAITSQSLRSAETMEEGRRAIESRLLALSRAHDLLLKQNWTSSPLIEVIQRAVEPYAGHAKARFVTEGADFDVVPVGVLAIAMTINELCTNAVKYGALSVDTGRVGITWAIDEGSQRFRLTWREMNGPTVRMPARRGFGTSLIEHGLPGNLKGKAQLKYEPDGVVCEFDVPLASLRVPSQQ